MIIVYSKQMSDKILNIFRAVTFIFLMREKLMKFSNQAMLSEKTTKIVIFDLLYLDVTLYR